MILGTLIRLVDAGFANQRAILDGGLEALAKGDRMTLNQVWTLFKNAVKGEDGSFNQLKEWSEEIHDDEQTVVGLVDRARRAGPEKLPAEEPED